MTKSDILENLIIYYGNGNKAKFAAMIGITPQLLSNWSKRDTLDYEKVYNGCPNLSDDWLLSCGEVGDMLKGISQKVDIASIKESIGHSFQGNKTASIGVKIKELMSKEKMDAPALAKRLNKSKQAVYVMLDKEDVSTSVLKELAEIFHVPVTYFLTDNKTTLDDQEEISALKRETALLKSEVERLRELKLPTWTQKHLM